MCIHTKEKKRKMEMKYIKELEKFAFFVFERKKDDIRVRFRFLQQRAIHTYYHILGSFSIVHYPRGDCARVSKTHHHLSFRC